MNATKIVSSAIIGADSANVFVGGKAYSIFPPTVSKLAGAGYYLSGFGNEKTISDVIRSIGKSDKLAHALSWFIKGDDTLAEELKNGTIDELVDALIDAFSLVSVENFTKLSTLVKNVASLIAKQR